MNDYSTNNTIIIEDHRVEKDRNVKNKKLKSYIAEQIINLIKDDYEEELSQEHDVFDSSTTSPFTIQEILEKFIDRCEINETSLIIALILLDRFSKYNNRRLTVFNIHR